MGDVWNFSVFGPFWPWHVVMSLACLVRWHIDYTLLACQFCYIDWQGWWFPKVLFIVTCAMPGIVWFVRLSSVRSWRRTRSSRMTCFQDQFILSGEWTYPKDRILIMMQVADPAAFGSPWFELLFAEVTLTIQNEWCQRCRICVNVSQMFLMFYRFLTPPNCKWLRQHVYGRLLKFVSWHHLINFSMQFINLISNPFWSFLCGYEISSSSVFDHSARGLLLQVCPGGFCSAQTSYSSLRAALHTIVSKCLDMLIFVWFGEYLNA